MTRTSVFRTIGLGSALLWAIACPPASVWGQGLTTIASFNGADGADPIAGVTLDANGDLFGTTSNINTTGGGTVWEIAKGSSTITTIASFNGSNGFQPFGGVTLDANGDLFGTTAQGGAYNKGTVWEIAQGSGTITTLASFNGSNGAGPQSHVTFDANGNVFGTTAGGGANSRGTVWEIAKGSSTITTLASFNGSNGFQPLAGVTIDANGNLYGTTSGGGSYGYGTVWEIAKGSNTITSLVTFNYANGASPEGGVTLDANGNLFGTTAQGGANGAGTVWEIARGSSTLTTLASFAFNSADGGEPYAGVTLDANGNLFGTAVYGGAYGDGTVWEIAQGTSTITILASLYGTNGSAPQGDVTIDADGVLYGTTVSGGAYGDGTVWEDQPPYPPPPGPVPEPSSIVTGLIGLVLAGGFVLANRTRATATPRQGG